MVSNCWPVCIAQVVSAAAQIMDELLESPIEDGIHPEGQEISLSVERYLVDQ